MATPKILTIYSFGYWGWGTATKQLVKLMDAAETARGNAPPFFVDVRIRRSGRAPGFVGDAFETLVGADRYLWEPRLGNEAVITHSVGMTIAEPAAASALLERAIKFAKKKVPLVFFCACEWPHLCHRHVVGGLILKEAKKRGIHVRVVEWPGGDPYILELDVPAAEYKKIARGRKSISITDGLAFEYADLPWGSIAKIQGDGAETLYAIAGPPKYGADGWYFPLPWNDTDHGLSKTEILREGVLARAGNALNPREV